MSDKAESINTNEYFRKAYSKVYSDFLKTDKCLFEKDMDRIKKCRKEINKLLASIHTYNSFRELSIAKTKLEEAEMWLSKLIKDEE